MSNPAILGVYTGVPGLRHTQEQVADDFIEHLGVDARRARVIRAIFQRAGVRYRHSVVDKHFYAADQSTAVRNERYMEAAIPLGEQVLRQGLDAAGYAPDEIDDFIVVSCTGVSIPGLDLHLAARLGMRPDLQRTCILGMGCYAAFPGMLRARQAVTDRPIVHRHRRALVLALELCSLHLQSNSSPENIIASALFSDGAAMVLLGAEEDRRVSTLPAGPRVLDSLTHCDYTTLDHMTFTLTDHGFRMYLSGYVPDLLAANVESFIEQLLVRNRINRGHVRFWAIHPGGSRIIDQVQDRLHLTDEQVEHSHAVLAEYGNMSSPTILFVLDRILRCAHPAPGDYGVLMAFGPGLTMESMLVQW